MMKRTFLLLIGLLLLPVLVLAQDDGDADNEIAYLRLNSNFSVPEIRGWDVTAENETVLFTRDDIQAQIYVRIVDTLDTTLAIDAAISDVDSIVLETDEPVYEGRIGRTDGTWVYRIFSDGDVSVTAYALLQSNQVYVVLFSEESADYDAYHLALRSPNNDPRTEEDINNAILPISSDAISHVFDATVADNPVSTRNPVEDNSRWLEATYDNNISTASYLFDGIVYVTAVSGDVDLTAQLSDAFDSVFLGFVITPDNGQYLLLGLAFSTIIMLALIGSMVLRYQNLKKDMQVLDQLEED